MFNRLDTSDDRRIDSSEFKSGADMVKGWGVELKDDEIEAEFAKIDVDGGGKILFDEFARWALEKALDLPEDDQEAGEGQEAAGGRAREVLQGEPLLERRFVRRSDDLAMEELWRGDDIVITERVLSGDEALEA